MASRVLWVSVELSIESPCGSRLPPPLKAESVSTWIVGETVLVSRLVSHSAVVQSLSHVWFSATPWTAAGQASLSFIISWSLLKLRSIESTMPSNHLIPSCPLLLLPSIFSSIRVFSNESTLRIRWPKYWGFSLSISSSNEHSGLISFRMDWLNLVQSKGLLRVFSDTTAQKHQFFGAQLSLQSNSHIHA